MLIFLSFRCYFWKVCITNGYSNHKQDKCKADIGKDHRTSLKSRLKYGHEYSLRKRLTELLDRLSSDSRLLIADDTSGFIGKVIDTRNHLTHPEEGPQGWTGDYIALAEAVQRLLRLLAALLWQHLGIEDLVVQKAISKIETDPYQI